MLIKAYIESLSQMKKVDISLRSVLRYDWVIANYFIASSEKISITKYGLSIMKHKPGG